ncbi:response regulator [Paenibacillus cymbidii]|uniref:response regulator n=1 Tax=Paenibacillus cymbidii TaxID=1639034 RepID=UPI001436B8F6|nr:response regulator [Paenibacillus cymbidii]
MFRLLIVDDIKIVADGLMDMLRHNMAAQLELFKAYSAFEALDVLSGTKIDIVLTDIKMPVKTGIDLLREIRGQWPRCKVIFLTSYNDFEYAKELINQGGFEYVLKTEGDERIVQVIGRAVQTLNAELRNMELIERAQTDMDRAKSTHRKEYALEMLEGIHKSEVSRRQQFAYYHIPLAADKPVFVLIARMDGWKELMNVSDRTLLLYAVSNIAAEYFSASLYFLHTPFERTKLVWLLQPRQVDLSDEEAWKRAARFLYGTLETVQETCRELLQLRISFLLGRRPVPWEELPDKFQSLLFMLKRGIGFTSELLLTDEEFLQLENSARGGKGTKSNSIHPLLYGQFSLLFDYLHSSRKEPFIDLYRELLELVAKQAATNEYAKVEAYYFLASIFLSFLNERNVMTDLHAKFDLSPLFVLDPGNIHDDFGAYFEKLANLIFESNLSETNEKTNRIVSEVQQYVHHHMHEDISLPRLGEVVHLNPSYLSRLYKEMTGLSISDYIIEVKLIKAKDLLRNSHLKIHEIAQTLGYNSSIAFIRFFKKITNMTPLEYRESLQA